MHPLTKQTQKQLKGIAESMPMVLQNTHEKHFMTKEELDEMGYVGAEKMKDGTYVYPAPVQIAFNHYRALKKAWLKGGVKSCKQYILKIEKLPNA